MSLWATGFRRISLLCRVDGRDRRWLSLIRILPSCRADNKAVDMPGETVHHDTPRRAIIMACALGATVLQLLDQTIANVALPYMQGTFSSSFDEIT